MKQKLLNLRALFMLMVLSIATGAWAEEVTYKVASTTTVSTEGTAPIGSSAAYSQTYGTAMQMTSGKTTTLTLSGFAGCTITGVTISTKTNASSGAGSFTVKVGGTQIGSLSVSKLGSTYISKDITVESTKVGDGETVVISGSCTTNSVYCESYTITYIASGKTALGTPANLVSSNVTGSSADLSWDAVANASGYMVKVGSAEYSTTTNNYQVTGLEENTTYGWSVKTLAGTSDTYSDSNFSEEASFTTGDFVVAAGTYNIPVNKDLYGVSAGNNGKEQSVVKKGVTIVSGCKSSATSKTYYDATHIRYYTDSYLNLTAPEGYRITKVVFTADGTWNGSITSAPNGYTNNSKTWEGESATVNFSFAAQNRVSSIEVTYALPTIASLSSIAISGTPDVTEYWAGDKVDVAGLVATGSYSDGSEKDITKSVTFTVTPVTIAADTKTVSVVAELDDVKSTAYTYDVTVKTIANDAESAYTTAKAIELIDAGKDLATEVYVKGTISKIDNFNETYGSITYWLDDDSFEIYGGLNLEGAKFTSEDDLAEGDEVVVKGIIKKYTPKTGDPVYEMDKNNVLVSRVEPEEPTRPTKFHLGVTGYNPENNDPVTVAADVFEDYSFEVTVPAAGADVLGANKATIDISMTDVASLGVEGTRSISKTVETGVEGVSVSLSEMLKNSYSFAGATVPVTIKDTEATKKFTYNIAEMADNKIVATPSSTDAARAAWMQLTSHVEAATTAKDDSYVGFKKGTYVQFGKERLTFDHSVNALEGNWSIESTVKDIKDAASLATLEGAADNDAIIFLPAGSQLQLGSSVATLKDDATITLDVAEGVTLTGALTQMQQASNNGKYAMIYTAVTMFDQIVGMVSGATVPVTVEFVKPVEVNYYAGNADEQTTTQNLWPEVLEATPNAVAFVTSELASWAADQKNVVVEYTVGTAGKYYECPEFILTDKVDFYTPVDFTALTGSYSRQPNSANASTANVYYNSYCVPFALSASDLSSTAKMLTFSFYSEKDGDRNVYFEQVSSINAGTPCIIEETGTSWNNYEFDKTEIVANPNNDNNMKGTFVATTEFTNSDYYTINVENKFGPLKNTMKAFRSCLLLKDGTSIDVASKSVNIVVLDDEATGINNVNISADDIDGIYTVNGAQVNELQKGVNIIKMKDGSVRKVAMK